MACGLAGCLLSAQGQATDLIISEYVEGSGNNKYIELYNGTGSNVALSNYQLQWFSNGSGTASNTLPLTGTLAPGATIVYAHNSHTAYSGTVTTNNTVLQFNGDDTIALWKVSTGTYVDIFGNIGCDPGSAWIDGSHTTVNRTLVRKPHICTGVTVDPAHTGNTLAGCPFPTLVSEWDLYLEDDVSNLGAHTMTCGPTATFNTATSTVAENVGTTTINLAITPATTATSTLTIQVNNGPGAYHPQDYTMSPSVVGGTVVLTIPAGATAASFSISVVDDALSELAETITFSMTGATGGLVIGGNATHALTITDNDNTPTYRFITPPTSVLESVGTVTMTIGILPNAGAGGPLTVNIANGPGAVHGADYTTNPNGSTGTITLNVPAGATTVTFDVTIVDDAVLEDTETLTFTINSVPAGALVDTHDSTVLSIGDNDAPAATMARGDIAIIGVNAGNNTCGYDDLVSFICFKPITPGTTIDVTDNGFGCNPNQWGDNEGFLRFTRTGPTIPPGQVITLAFATSISGNGMGVAPDALWNCTRLGNLSGNFLLNNSGDQLFFLQGGVWTDPSGTYNATYTGGNVLYGFSTSGAWAGGCSATTSALPPQLECYSMAPTASSAYSKFTGNIVTPKTQREWLIALDDPANWTSTYANCNAYNTSAPLWELSPTLPIIAGPMQNGLWTGAKSTDWFDCRNWDDAQVPTATSNVVIDQRFTPNCSITLPNSSSATTAECASLTIRSNNSLGKTLLVDQGRTLTVTGTTLIERTNGLGAACGMTLQGGSTFNTQHLTLRGVTSLAQETYFNNTVASNTMNVTGNLRNEIGGRFTLTGGTLQLGGNFTNLNSDARFEEVNSTVVLNGAGTQNISTDGSVEVFHQLRVQKSAGTVMLNNGISITNNLDLLWGRIFQNSSLLTLQSSATVTGANDNSFVHGAVRKVGNTDFIFPIGKGVHYRPAHITQIEGTVTDGFRAEYYDNDPMLVYTPYAADAGVHHISHCEYWTIDRSGGNATAWVGLTWNSPSSCGVDALPDLRVVRWDGTTWRNRGNGGATGNLITGTVITSGLQMDFSPWTLASVNVNNPLPIELLAFTARANGTAVDLTWTTASERNNAYFQVERSSDLAHFTPILTVPGAGNSQSELHYQDRDDAPLAGVNYYRLCQTDLDGTSTCSDVVPVHFDGASTISVHANGGALVVFHDQPANTPYRIMDASGRLISSGVLGDTHRSELDLPGNSSGVYLLWIGGTTGRTVRFVR